MSHDQGAVCVCVADHRPKAVELDEHHVLPRFLGGSDDASNRVWICPNTHRAAHEILRILLRDGRVDGDVVDDYPRYARQLAAEGFRRFKEMQP